MGRYVAPDLRAKAETYLAEGYSINETAKRCGLHYNTVAKWKKTRSGRDSPQDAQAALDDFALFRRRYFGRVTTPWQTTAALKLVELLESDFEEYVVMNVPPGSGKALALDTPIPTPSGWATMKELVVGEEVFGADGRPARVLAKSEVFYGHDCYEVSTDDDASVIADAGHLWPVRMHGHGQYGDWSKKPDYPGKSGPKASPDGKHLHTSEFLARPRSKRPQLAVAGALDMPIASLPVDPYTLGAWLGDGHSAGARLTAHPDDAPHIVGRIREAGYVVEQTGPMLYSITGSKKWCRDGLASHLRAAGLLNNKHVPPAYLRAHESQRLALLQGLIDTDGYVGPKGHVEFCSTSKRLAEGTLALVRSLGVKANMRTGRAMIGPKDCGEKYRVTFYLDEAASLPRKADLCRAGKRTPSRYLTAVPVESVPTQCIQVEGGTFLAGTGLMVTHNSTLLTDTCLWVLCRDRTTRILYGSRTQSQAEQYTRRIRAALERTDPVRAGRKELDRGLSHDADGVLMKDFGAFKPANNDLWRIEKFVVQVGSEQVSDDKEASVAAFGMDSGFLGGRFDLNVWDDLVDSKNLKTAESRETLQKWWDEIAETRVEPGGLVAVVGQRLSADDIYRYCLDLLGDDAEDLGDIQDHVGGMPNSETDERPRKYQHILFRAHDDTNCLGKEGHTLNAPAWPNGCLLDPKRLSWRKLAPIKANKGELFNVVYQQEDVDPAASLVKQVWIKGGKDSDGTMYPGCLDETRDLWTLPRLLSPGNLHFYVTVDPSPTRYWSVQAWCYDDESKMRFLLDHHRGRMDAPEFFDYDLATGTFRGLMEDWWQRFAERGWRLGHVVIEDNAAQRFMLQSDAIRRWSALRETLIVAHNTARNKSDPEFGVQMLAPIYMRGQVRLPYGSEQARFASMKLIHEVTRWPHGSTDDAVMSQWFGEHRLSQIAVPRGVVYQFKRPSWIRGAA